MVWPVEFRLIFILCFLQLQFDAICVFCFEGIEFCFKSPLSRFQDGLPNFRSLFFRSMSLGSFLGVALQQVLKKNPRSEN